MLKRHGTFHSTLQCRACKHAVTFYTRQHAHVIITLTAVPRGSELVIAAWLRKFTTRHSLTTPFNQTQQSPRLPKHHISAASSNNGTSVLSCLRLARLFASYAASAIVLFFRKHDLHIVKHCFHFRILGSKNWPILLQDVHLRSEN